MWEKVSLPFLCCNSGWNPYTCSRGWQWSQGPNEKRAADSTTTTEAVLYDFYSEGRQRRQWRQWGLKITNNFGICFNGNVGMLLESLILMTGNCLTTHGKGRH